MDELIKKQLETAPLPKESDVALFRDSVDNVRRCLRSLLRGRCVMRVRQELKRDAGNPTPVFVPDSGPAAQMPAPESASDERFNGHICMGLPVAVDVLACLGVGEENANFWIGFRKETSTDADAPWTADAALVAEEVLQKKPYTGHAHWHAWTYLDDVNFENCADEFTAQKIARRLVGLRDLYRKRHSESVLASQHTPVPMPPFGS